MAIDNILHRQPHPRPSLAPARRPDPEQLQARTMTSESSPPASPTQRRSSFASGQTLSELFGRSPPNNNGSSSSGSGRIATAAAHANAQQRRRTSLAGLGLAGSPPGSSPFLNMRNRNSSIGSSNSPNSSIEESAIEDGDAPPAQSPTTPLARRMSFGAKAYHDLRSGGNSTTGAPSSRLFFSSVAQRYRWNSLLDSENSPLEALANIGQRP